MNKPGCEVDDLKGGVAGGSILKGVLKVGGLHVINKPNNSCPVRRHLKIHSSNERFLSLDRIFVFTATSHFKYS